MKIFNKVLLFGLAAFAPSSVTAPVPDIEVDTEVLEGWEFDNGHYYQFVPDLLKWSDAEAAAETSLTLTSCGEFQGHLATITSLDENDFVFSLLPTSGLAWLGGFRPVGTPEPDDPSGGWRWLVTGEDWEYADWSGGARTTDQCLGVDGDNWNDESCTSLHAYVMELAGPTFHIGDCDTGIFDPTYNWYECTSTAADDMLECTNYECVEKAGEAAGLAQWAVYHIVETCLPSCEVPCPDIYSCGNGDLRGTGTERFTICQVGQQGGRKQRCIAASAWPGFCHNPRVFCGPCCTFPLCVLT
jgi:hypothetical protein